MGCDVIGTFQLKLHILLCFFFYFLLFSSSQISFFFDLHTYSRHAREINIPAAMKREMPKIAMDCELWYGRGQYSLSSAMVSKNVFFHWDFMR